MPVSEDHQPPPGQDEERTGPARKSGRRFWGVLLAAIGLLLVLGLLFLAGYLPRRERQRQIEAAAQREADALPAVNVMQVRRAPPIAYVLLPGSTSPLTEAYLYARATGYIRSRYADIGDRVRAGQLLAEIDAPDLDAQVAQARATLAQSERELSQAEASLQNSIATEELGRVTWERYRVLVSHGAVSRQDADQQLTTYRQASANVLLQQAAVKTAQENIRANRANLERLLALQDFKNVRAPFDGVITSRNFDIGAYINVAGGSSGMSQTPLGGTQAAGALGNAGSTGTPATTATPPTSPSTGAGSAANSELFRMAQIRTLRILINVPQINAPGIRVGQPASVTTQEFLGKTFAGKVTRTSNSLDPTARTLLAEVQVSNPQLLLLPGMYAHVQFGDVRSSPPLIVPGEAVIANANGLQVAILVDLTSQDRERITRERRQLQDQNPRQEQSADRQQPGQDYVNAKRIQIRRVQVGRDYGQQIEIIAGLEGWEYVVVNPGDDVREGVIVTPHSAPIVARATATGGGGASQQPGGISAPSPPTPAQGGQERANSGGSRRPKGRGGGK
jgi:multidrug efflux pump subunit AcrA (membrane-fusion protein)